ncbi:MAG: Rqc2 family fibronectin-binding protein [Cyanobium sp.]
MAAIQAIDVTTLRALLAELRPRLLPSRFEKAQQPDPQSLQLALRGLEGCHWLELGWEAEAPRMLATAAPPRRGEGSTLAQQLQHSLRGLALVALHQEGWERVVELVFARRPGDPPQRFLVLELMGRHSNLFLLDGQRRVVAAARQVRSSQSRLRPIGTGDPYAPPPPLQGESPRLSESQADWIRRLTLQPLSLRQALQRSYQGISPALIGQLLDGLEEAALLDQPVQTLHPAQWQALHGRWRSWLEAVQAERFRFREGGGSTYRCWESLPTPGDSMAAAAPLAPAALPLNAALAGYYGAWLAARHLQRRRDGLRQRLEGAITREDREARRQEELLAAVPGGEELRRRADALLCRPDPGRAVVEEAQKLYHQARRLRRSVAAITPRLAQHRSRLAWLETTLHFLETSDDLPALEDLEQDLDALLSPRQGERRRRREAGSPRPLEFRSPRGLRLQVGRNHRQNDWISLRQARRGDLWFHAQECPGSHVVLKASEAPSEAVDLATAADLAAHFSRARGNRRVPVVMVPIETLQRIPGEPPGTVRHGPAELLWGEPDRVAPLLASLGSGPAEEAGTQADRAGRGAAQGSDRRPGAAQFDA